MDSIFWLSVTGLVAFIAGVIAAYWVGRNESAEKYADEIYTIGYEHGSADAASAKDNN